MYGGQGKNDKVITEHCDITLPSDAPVDNGNTGEWAGLKPPHLETTGDVVRGDSKHQMRKENKIRRRLLKLGQTDTPQWTAHTGTTIPIDPTERDWPPYRNAMCPSGCAVTHPAAPILTEWATFGCPTRTGRPWTKEEMWEAVARGPHQSALSPDALAHFAAEAENKVRMGQARLVLWDDIKDDPPRQLKISPIAAIPHKLKAYRSILDLSFRL